MICQTRSLHWFRVRIPVALLMILTVCAGISIAADGPTAESASTTAPAAPVTAEPTVPAASTAAEAAETDPDNGQTTFGTAVDETHAGLERNILEQVIRLDSFFGNFKTGNQPKAEYQLRWRNSLRVEQGGQVKAGATLRANLRLSRINERLRLVVSGENEPVPFSSSLPEDPGSPGYDRSSPTTRMANTELRYDLVQTPSMYIFLGAGVRFSIPPEPFLRSRFQYSYKIGDASLVRVSETLFVKKYDVLGETTELNLERLLDRITLLRWANTGTLSSEIKGMEWGSELSLIRELSPSSGITLTAGAYGNTAVNDWVDSYRILSRYRQSFLRSWLFYELEPEVSWPRRGDGNFTSTYAFTVRLEIVFQGKEQ
jgi:hypothetical protein